MIYVLALNTDDTWVFTGKTKLGAYMFGMTVVYATTQAIILSADNPPPDVVASYAREIEGNYDLTNG